MSTDWRLERPNWKPLKTLKTWLEAPEAWLEAPEARLEAPEA